MLQLDKSSLGRLTRLQLAAERYPEGLSNTAAPTHDPDTPALRHSLSCCSRSCG